MHSWRIPSRDTHGLVLFGLVGSAIGLLTPIAVEQVTSGAPPWLAIALLFVPVLLLMALRPVLGAAAVVGFGFVNPSLLPPLIEVGELSIRLVDGMFCLLICLVAARSVIGRRAAMLTEARPLFTPLLLFLLYIGLSLIVVSFSSPHFLGAPVASYMRLLLTASFAPMLCITLRDHWDIRFLNKTLIFFFLATVAIAARLVWAVGAEAFEARTGGVIGIGPLGLVSGLLVLYAFIDRDRSPRSTVWIVSLTVGLLGLYLAKTVSAAFAAAVTATVYFASMRSRRFDLLKWAVIGTIALTVAATGIWIARPSDVSGVGDVSSGSFAERLMIGYAGVQLFLNNPIIGVGWQASTSEAVIGTHALTAMLKENFNHLPTQYFSHPPTSLHNMYIQFLAELGLLGTGLFVWVCFRLRKSLRRIIKSMAYDSPYKTWAQFYALGLVYLLIWWNNSSLFGGQIETILAFTFVAGLASVARLEKQRLDRSSLIDGKY